VFHTKIKNFQEQNCTLTDVGALSCTPINVPEVTSKGFEADVRASAAAAATGHEHGGDSRYRLSGRLHFR
jgi:hypothetical protein